MDKHTKELWAQVEAARNFPHNTTPASRHVELIADALTRGKPYAMLSEEPEHCGGSMVATLASLYEAKNEIDRLRAALIAERERCAKIADAEPELPGDMPPELQLVPLEDALRAAVRVTKKVIAAAIRAARSQPRMEGYKPQ